MPIAVFSPFMKAMSGLKLCDLRIVPDAKVMLVDQANLLDGGGLDKDKPKAAERIAAEMHVVKDAAGAAGPGAVVDHRRHDQAVLQRQAADLEGLEQQRACGIDAVGAEADMGWPVEWGMSPGNEFTIGRNWCIASARAMTPIL